MLISVAIFGGRFFQNTRPLCISFKTTALNNQMNYYVNTSFLKAFPQAAGYLNQDALEYWQDYPSIILKKYIDLVVSSPKNSGMQLGGSHLYWDFFMAA